MIKKISKNTILITIGIILGLTAGVYAATQIASSNVTYTNNNQENVQGAIDDLYNKTKDYNVCDNNKNITTTKKCKRAEYLHQETCDQIGCKSDGYTESGEKKTSTITYGKCGTDGTLIAGDAFDCDVNGDGYFDSETERFYYVSPLYLGGDSSQESSWNENIAVLIYYSNTMLGIADNTELNKIKYDLSVSNYNGPITGISNLPLQEKWSNISLTDTSKHRNIYAENGNNTTANGTQKLPGNDKESFDYSNYAARLLTYQEIKKTCGEIYEDTKMKVSSCNYLVENLKYNNINYGLNSYWLETPYYANSSYVWFVSGSTRNVDYYRHAGNDSDTGVRPAIEVAITDIEY